MPRYVAIPDLNQRMIAVGATNQALADASGACLSTVALLRAQKRKAERWTVENILQALETKTFQLQKRGRKPKCLSV